MKKHTKENKARYTSADVDAICKAIEKETRRLGLEKETKKYENMHYTREQTEAIIKAMRTEIKRLNQ